GHFQYTRTDQERIPHSPSGGDFHGKIIWKKDTFFINWFKIICCMFTNNNRFDHNSIPPIIKTIFLDKYPITTKKRKKKGEADLNKVGSATF
ncbi:hypothetical protein, partial [Parageobacillus toebii]|uniref:hypothetical protein n=1 Tax=Parageobacillus toebii TaxID=153151 RepID=UPI001F3F402C